MFTWQAPDHDNIMYLCHLGTFIYLSKWVDIDSEFTVTPFILRFENISKFKEDVCFQIFDPLRKERPTDLSKVLPIEGDITQPELDISQSDRTLLSRSVNVVFHSAATVKFDEKLKLSVTINMLGTQRLVELCKRMSNLEALVCPPFSW